MRRLQLDQVWLLVSPGNPLKEAAGMAPFADRLASARRLADGRRIVATGIEARMGTRFTADTLEALVRLFPRVLFVWIMGADNLAQFPRWRRWREIASELPIVVLPRPGWRARAMTGQAAHRLRHTRRRPREAPGLARRGGWIFLPAAETALSATLLRGQGARPHKDVGLPHPGAGP